MMHMTILLETTLSKSFGEVEQENNAFALYLLLIKKYWPASLFWSFRYLRGPFATYVVLSLPHIIIFNVKIFFFIQFSIR